MIGVRLREERERLGHTQPAFAELAGAKKRTLIDWEKGVSSPTAVQLAALASAGVDVLFVVTGKHSNWSSPTNLETGQRSNRVTSPDLEEGGTERSNRARDRSKVATSQPLAPKEQVILDSYRAGTPEQQDFILKAALGFTGVTAAPTPEPTAHARPITVTGNRNRVAGRNFYGRRKEEGDED